MNFSRLHGRSAKPGALALVCAVTVLAATGCGDDNQRSPLTASQEPAARGSVISATPVADLDAKEVVARLAKTGIDTAQVRYGVRAHRIVYRTVDIKGRPTTASELVAMPKNDDPDLRVVSWLHSTEVYRGEVASVNDELPDRATALLFARVDPATTPAHERVPDQAKPGISPPLTPTARSDS
ncbi:hypothetical protein [Streptomyces sp. NPDC051286]|uniref:hypothetical protein n=1 Tax=Streptomyces sp. NPDC051286 TaxID=3365647 RepID=UPI0037A0823F